jgi:hypothetical protein
MPLNNSQLAELVKRAKQKAQPVVSLPLLASQHPPPVPPTLPSPTPQPEPAAEAEDFPIGWELRKESWRFHRRFYAVFHRPMACGRILLPAPPDTGWSDRASREGLPAGDPTGQQQNAAGPRHSVAADHHPAQGLAAADIGRIG